jgi:ATP-binding protein involved in chromosome partitioning
LNLSQVEIHTNEKKQLIPLDVGRLKVMSFGFLLGDAPAVMRGPMVSRYIQQLLHFTDWGELEYLFIDMPPGTGDMQLTLTQSARLNGAVIVTTRHTLSLVDVARGILMFEKVDVPILGVIENMSYFLCDGCGKKHYIFGGDENNTLTERFGIPLLAELPILPELLGNFNKASQNELIQEAVDKVIRALGKSTIEQKSLPKIQFDEKAITLTWPEGEEVTVNNRDLRMSCRCALCVDELTGRKLFKNKDIRPDIAPLEVTPLGNYAIGVTWNDGHSSGIYPYKNIRELAETKVK